MTTGEFIKLLQEEDPSGTAHLRMSGGIPKHVELKAGYWDGPYSYFDEEGNWVYSIKDNKVDVYCEDIDDFVANKINAYRIPAWEDIKSKFRFELGGYAVEGQRNERAENVLKKAKETYDEIVEIEERFQAEYEAKAIERAKSGWQFYQDMEVDNIDLKPNFHHFYTWLIYDENGKLQEHGSNVATTAPVSKSGKFKRKISEIVHGYYEWTLKENI